MVRFENLSIEEMFEQHELLKMFVVSFEQNYLIMMNLIEDFYLMIMLMNDGLAYLIAVEVVEV